MQQAKGERYCCRTKVEGAGKTLCCNNCAIALAEGAEHRTGQG